jgi:hypothetical protein
MKAAGVFWLTCELERLEADQIDRPPAGHGIRCAQGRIDVIVERVPPLVCQRGLRIFGQPRQKIENNPHNPHNGKLPDPRPNYCPNVGLNY